MIKIFFCSLLLLSCTSLDSKQASSSFLPFSDVEVLKRGVTTSSEIKKKFGEPSSVENDGAYTSWTYYFPRTQTQRLTLNFFSSTGILESMLWLPESTEKEAKFQFLKSKFPTAKFETSTFGPENPHAISSERVSTDDNLGISFLHDNKFDFVEAVAWLGPKTREVSGKPSDSKKRIPIHIVE